MHLFGDHSRPEATHHISVLQTGALLNSFELFADAYLLRSSHGKPADFLGK